MALDLRINEQPCTTTAAPHTIAEWEPVEFACTPPPGATVTLAIGGALQRTTLQPFLRPGDAAWRWHWNPQNSIGRVAVKVCITWPDGSSEQLHAALEVVPRKIDQECYTLLLRDLQRSLAHVLTSLQGALVGGRFVPPAAVPPANRSSTEHMLDVYARLFGEQFATLERVVRRIARQPHTTLCHTTHRVEPGTAYDLSQPPAPTGSAAPAVLLEREPGDTIPVPATIDQPHSYPTTDTPENRLVLRLLDELRRRALAIAELAERERHIAGSAAIAEQCRAAAQRLDALRALPFLAEVQGSPAAVALLPRGATHVMQRNPEYRLIYRMWRDLPRDPIIDIASDMLHLPLAELPLLYERWCLLQMIAAVLALPEVRVCSQSLAGAERGERGECSGHIALVQDHPLLVLEWRGTRLHLRYQPRYAPPAQRQRAVGSAPPPPPLCSLDSHTHIPDMALEMVAPDGTPAAVVLDAKYRLKEGGGLPHDALADAYTYLGSIGLPGGVRATRAVALLYPGEGAAEHYASGVAVLPLLPGSTTPLHDLLHTLLPHLLQ